MSFLNPSASAPKLGIDITRLLELGAGHDDAIEPGAAWVVGTAESSGADAIILTLNDIASAQTRSEIDVVLMALTDSQLRAPPTAEMIDFVCSAQPGSVCFQVEQRDRDTSLHMIEQAAKRCDSARIRMMIAIDDQLPLDQLQQAGVTTIEFDVTRFLIKTSDDKSAPLHSLRQAVVNAQRLGILVQLGGAIGYRHIAELAELGNVEQINVGRAIVSRAVMIGLAAAVSEMKALIITSYLPKVTRYA